MTRSMRRAAAIGAVAAIGIAAGCHAGGSTRPFTQPTSGPVPATTATVSLIPQAVPPVTEPAADVAKLRAILLVPADLAPGFTSGPAGVTGDDLVGLRLCSVPLADNSTATATVRQVLQLDRDHLRVVEEVNGYPGAGPAAVTLSGLRGIGQRCRRDGATTVRALQPPAVGEEVAGLQLSRLTGVIDVAMIRSGPLVAIVVLAAGSALAARTFQAVVQAAGTKLAVATGG